MRQSKQLNFEEKKWVPSAFNSFIDTLKNTEKRDNLTACVCCLTILKKKEGQFDLLLSSFL